MFALLHHHAFLGEKEICGMLEKQVPLFCKLLV